MEIKTIAASIVLGISLITGVIAVDSRYATSSDLKNTEIQMVQTIDKLQKSMVRDRLEQRFINLTDQYYQYKILLKKNPNDFEIKEDFQKIEIERMDVKRQLEESKITN